MSRVGTVSMKIMAVWGDPTKGGSIDSDIKSRINNNIADAKPIVKIATTKDSFKHYMKTGLL